MVDVRTFLALALALLFIPSAPPAVGAPAPDFRIVLSPGAAPAFEGTGLNAVLVREVPGELLEWNVSTTKTRLVGTVESGGYFQIDHPAQVLPEIDDGFPPQCRPEAGWPKGFDSWHFFGIAYEETIWDAGECGRLANVTGDGGNAHDLLAFPVNATKGNVTLRLSRDVQPPAFEVGTVQNVTHYGFYFETRTTEWAYASLIIAKAGKPPVENPTAILALLQRFPVQGLDPASEYVFHVEFWDWSGNRARSQDLRMTTTPAPRYPPPVITSVAPAPNTTVREPLEISVDYTSAEGTVSTVNIFLDKTAVPPDRVHVGADHAAYTPATSLAPGHHVVGVEVVSSLGAMATRQWAFEVEAKAAAAAPDFAFWIAALCVAILLSRR